jgi:2-polyprenyl-3-methyl-5-hydroxy-6-metoxy-1,4-benzoquinol methylase
MSKKAWFTQWFNSSHYHHLYSHRDEQEAADFIFRLLEHLHPAPGAHILDVGCGRGRHSRTLASKGFEVTGIDVAPDNIEYALQFANEQLHFQVHDMRKLLCARCFNYVFNFFTSFGFFNTQTEHRNAIHMMASALKKEGILVMDYLNAVATAANLVPTEEKQVDGTHYQIERWMNERYIFKKITIQDKDLSQPLSFTEQVARFSKEDLCAMLKEQGLEIVEVFGNYQLEAFEETTSQRLIIVAKQPH